MINAKAIGLARARDLHQTIISGTIYNMWPEIIARRGWRLMGEGLVTDNPNDNYPDIVIKDEYKRLVFSLEITRKKYISYDIRKCHQLQQRFPNAEFYIFNYETDTLYALGDDGLWYNSNENSINSRLFEQPLMEYIYLPEEY
jgi:hypothetical protein